MSKKQERKKMSAKTKAVVSLIINLLMTVVTTSIIISYFFVELNQIIQSRQEIFYYFTTDSNILAAIAAIVVAVFDIQIIRGKRTMLPKGAVIFKFVGTSAVMLTLMTCLLYLAPRYGFGFIFGGTYLHVHLMAPLMAFISMVCFERGHRISIPQSLLAYLPVAVYGTVYYIMAILIGEENGGWRDLYHFNDSGMWMLAVVAIVITQIVVVVVSRLVYNIGAPKKLKA